MKYGIRQATLEDMPFLVDCLQAMLTDMESCGGQPLAEANRVKGWLMKYTDNCLLQNDHLFLMVVPEGEGMQPVGMLEAYLAYPDEAFLPVRKLHIAALYVRPERRQEGLGRRLMEEAIQWGREQGCVEVELNVLAGNPARRLYESMGFEVFEVQLRCVLYSC